MTLDEHTPILRCPHDRENPYSMISNALIRDESISPNCRWMLIFLLSNSGNWEIKPAAIINHVNKFFGRDAVYALIDEAIDAGYMIREYYKVNNLKRSRYLLSETPKFKKSFRHPENSEIESQHINSPYELKKSFRHPDFQDTGAQSVGKTDTKNKQDLKNEQKEEIKTPAPCVAPLSKDSNKSFNEETKQLCHNLYDRLKAHFPALKEPNWVGWYSDMDKLIRIDKKPVSDVKEMIDWVMEHAFWVKNIRSPDALRRNYEKMYMQKTPVQNSGSFYQANRSCAHECKSACKKNEKKFNDIVILNDGVLKRSTGEKILYSLNTIEFNSKMCAMFNLTMEN